MIEISRGSTGWTFYRCRSTVVPFHASALLCISLSLSISSNDSIKKFGVEIAHTGNEKQRPIESRPTHGTWENSKREMSKRAADDLNGAPLKAGQRPENGAPTQNEEGLDFEDDFEDEFESEDEIMEAGVDGRPDAEREAEAEASKGSCELPF